MGTSIVFFFDEFDGFCASFDEFFLTDDDFDDVFDCENVKIDEHTCDFSDFQLEILDDTDGFFFTGGHEILDDLRRLFNVEILNFIINNLTEDNYFTWFINGVEFLFMGSDFVGQFFDLFFLVFCAELLEFEEDVLLELLLFLL